MIVVDRTYRCCEFVSAVGVVTVDDCDGGYLNAEQ